MGSGLEIGLRALLTAQSALDVIGHNISNANTPGYSRQDLMVSPTRPQLVRGMQMGSGVLIGSPGPVISPGVGRAAVIRGQAKLRVAQTNRRHRIVEQILVQVAAHDELAPGAPLRHVDVGVLPQQPACVTACGCGITQRELKPYPLRVHPPPHGR